MPISLNHYQIKQLLEISEAGGEPESYDTLVLMEGDDRAHSGPGLYAYFQELPEEGAMYIGVDEEDDERAAKIAEAREEQGS